jgi:hypothetical protein
VTTTLKKGISKLFAYQRHAGQDTHTATPVRTDAKHSFPILGRFRGHATGEIFGFAPISTADEAPGASQAEPAKLAQVEVLPQLQEGHPELFNVTTLKRKKFPR